MTGFAAEQELRLDGSWGGRKHRTERLAAERSGHGGMVGGKPGLTLLATSTPDDLFGSAPRLQARRGVNAAAFDLTAARSGFCSLS